jgi:hypothetical protein
MDTQCHFFATSHDKDACDGIWGTIKRLARKASPQSPYEHIMTQKTETTLQVDCCKDSLSHF